MIQEDKGLLLKDLSARLPCKTYVKTEKGIGYVYAINTSQLIELSIANESEYWSEVFNLDEIKPYLRTMSSMTEEEEVEYNSLMENTSSYFERALKELDWLNSHHFDYRGLIEKGLALEAHEGMYNLEKK